MLDRRINPFRDPAVPEDIFGALPAPPAPPAPRYDFPAALPYPTIPNPFAAPPEPASYSAEPGLPHDVLRDLAYFLGGQPERFPRPYQPSRPVGGPSEGPLAPQETPEEQRARSFRNQAQFLLMAGLGPGGMGGIAKGAAKGTEAIDKQISVLEDELGAMQRTAAGKTLVEQTPAEAATLRRKSAQLTELRGQRERQAPTYDSVLADHPVWSSEQLVEEGRSAAQPGDAQSALLLPGGQIRRIGLGRGGHDVILEDVSKAGLDDRAVGKISSWSGHTDVELPVNATSEQVRTVAEIMSASNSVSADIVTSTGDYAVLASARNAGELGGAMSAARAAAPPPGMRPPAPPRTPPAAPQPPPEPPVAPPEAPGTVASATARLEELQRQRARFGNIVDAQGNPIYGATGERPPSAVAPTVGTRQLSRSLGAFPEDVQAALRAQGEALRPTIEKRTGAMSWDESKALADQVYKTALENAANLPQRGQLVQVVARWEEDLDARLAAARNVARAVVEGRASPQDKLEGLLALKEAGALRIRGEAGVSEVGRTLNFLRTSVQEAARNPTDAAWRAALKKATGIDEAKVDKFYEQMLLLGDDPVRMRAFVADTADVPMGRVITEQLQGNVLWDPATYQVNIQSGFLQMGLMLATSVGAKNPELLPLVLHSMVGGYKHTTTRLMQRYAELQALAPARRFEELFSSSAEQLLGMEGAGGPELRATRAIKAPPGAEGIGAAALNAYGTFGRVPRMALGVQDLYQTIPMADASLRYQAELAAKAQGFTLLDRLRRTPDSEAFVNRFLQAPPPEAKVAAFQEAEEWALHLHGATNTLVGKMAQGASQFREIMFGVPFMKMPYTLPLAAITWPVGLATLFINTPLMLAKQGFRLGPQGLLPGIGVRDLRARFAYAGIGTASMAEAVLLMANGDMTPARPKSTTESNEWQANGSGPLRIRASEYPFWGPLLTRWFAAQGKDPRQQWVPVGLLGPFALPYTMAAVGYQYVRDTGELPPWELAAGIGLAAGQALIQQLPLLSGLRSITDMLGSAANLQSIGKVLERTVVTAVPEESLLAFAERWSDDWRRDPKGAAEAVQAIIPYAAQAIRTQVDVLGRDMPNRGLMRETEEQPHPLLEESARLRAAVAEGDFGGLPKWSDKLGTDPVSGKLIQLSPDEAHEYSKLAGGNRDRLLTALVGMPEYQQLPVREQAKAFDQTRQQADEMARRWLGLSIAGKLASTDTTGTLRAWQLSMAGAGKLIERAQIARQWTDAGLMSGDLKRSVDASRTYVDPTAKNYQLSVDEQVKGLALIDQWRAAPAFITGNAAEWQTAAQLARDYNDVRDYLERVASRNGKRVTAMPEYQGLLRYYQSGPRDATGTPILAKYYTPAGSIREGLVSAERRSIAREPIWGHFSAYAEPAPDNPYRFAHPLPNVPGVTPPPSSGAGLVPFSPERPDLLVPP